MNRIWLLGFPHELATGICARFERIVPDTPVEICETFCPGLLDETERNLVMLYDSEVAIGQTMRLFRQVPTASLVVLASQGDAERASELMRAGAMDYRLLPCPDEALAIYLRKAHHEACLAAQARRRQESADAFVTEDITTRRLLDRVALISASRASVLILGESGTGKERLARFIHQCSDRHDGAFVAINCAAIPEGILEAELFGHEKGAFTGATQSRPGKFEIAHEGTLLLDEISEMPLHLQAKLLRVLQEGEIDRLGGRAPVRIDVRVIATSNRDMANAVREGSFRRDLYFRLNVVSVHLPPLRARPDDIGPLAKHFLSRFGGMYGKTPPVLAPDCLDRLKRHDWPGNARELENCMHRAFLMCRNDTLHEADLELDNEFVTPGNEKGMPMRAGMSIRDMEQALIRQTIQHVNGNRTEAAKLLGISIRTLRNKLHDMGTGMPLAGGDMASEATRGTG